MSILLIAAAVAQAQVDIQSCEHLNPSEISLLVRRVGNEEVLNPYGAPSLGDLVNYWRGSCSDERFKAGKHTVNELASLLRYWGARRVVSLMLLEVGPNLAAARGDVDTAIFDQAAREEALMKASAPIMPESGIGIADMLRCVRHRMDTGKLDPKLCWATYAP